MKASKAGVMGDENTFLLLFWQTTTISLVAVVATIAIYNIMQDEKIVSMVKLGASPIEASCALNDTRGENPTCVALALK